MEKSVDADSQPQQPKRLFAVFIYHKEINVLKTNLTAEHTSVLQNVFTHRVEKGIMYPEVGTVITVDLNSSEEGSEVPESDQKFGCYYFSLDIGEAGSEDRKKYLICFLLEQEYSLDLFRTELDSYCTDMVKPLKMLDISKAEALPASVVESLENWYSVAIDYLIRCQQSHGDKLKYFIYAALHDYKLVLSGGTADVQADIQRFYNACSLSDILSQLRETRLRQESDSMSGSVDMLVDVEQESRDTQNTLTVSISEDSVKLDSNGSNRFCEEWAGTINRPEFLDQPMKQKQVIEAYKLKFIQTMNTLKRLLREAENDYYALYRSYVFLRDSGNYDILLHYVNTEGARDVVNVIEVLQDFIQEQGPIFTR